jgi:aspartokinase
MSSSAKLAGFKILKGVVWHSFSLSKSKGVSLTDMFTSLTREKANMSMVTCVKDKDTWRVNIALESHEAKKALPVIAESVGNSDIRLTKGAILSIFPHQKNPKITGSVLDIYGKENIEPGPFASSPSAISVALREESIDKATRCLFKPLRFSAYRTPEDWKLAQKGKEKLYKEVVASFQEKKPKVYFIEWQDNQSLVQTSLSGRKLELMGLALKRFDNMGTPLNFLASNQLEDDDQQDFFFCLPTSTKSSYPQTIEELIPDARVRETQDIAMFSMNGPHFGDRYGITSELFKALDEAGVDLIGLNCSIHSVSGVVTAGNILKAIDGIKKRFEVPSVMKR